MLGTLEGNVWVRKTGDTMSGDLLFQDNIDALFGDSGDSGIFYSGADLVINSQLSGSGNVLFPNDDQALVLGASQDASILFDGTNTVIDSGGSKLICTDRLEVRGGATSAQVTSTNGSVIGSANDAGGGNVGIRATAAGAFASGRTNKNTAGVATCLIEATKPGATAFGSALLTSLHSAFISAKGYGSFAQGYIYASGGHGLVEATQYGAFAQGYVYSSGGAYARVQATQRGSFAQGRAVASAASNGYITSSGRGSFAQGNAQYGYITASQHGAFAQGFTSGGGSTIEALQRGAMARGYAKTGGYITADAKGAFAAGYANATTIAATALNSVQFGPGTNAIADSLQVGPTPGGASLDTSGSGGVLFLGEQATANTDVAGRGQLWVKDTAPCELWFTDDTGTDTQIV